MDALIRTKIIQELAKDAVSPPGSLPGEPEDGVLRRGAAWNGRVLAVAESPALLALGVLSIFVLVLLAYRPILPGEFIMDDRRLIESDNPIATGQLGPFSVFFQTEWAFSTLVFWWQWLVWGAHPGGYHAVNIALHALSAVLLWRLLARLKVPGAWLAGAIYGVHPVAVASVARIAEMKNTLSLPFFLLSAWLFLRFEDAAAARGQNGGNPRSANAGAGWYALSLLAFVFALLSKTSTIMLPLVLLAMAAFRRGRITRRDISYSIPFFGLSLVFGLLSVWFQKHVQLVGKTLTPETFWERSAIAGRAFWFYLGKALFPVNLNLVYPTWRPDVTKVMSFIPMLLIGVAFFLCWRARQRAGRTMLLALGIYWVTLFPALGFFDSQFLTRWQVSDHLQYLPLLVPVSLAAAGLALWLPAKVFRGAAMAIVLGLTVLTFQRAEAFATPEKLFRDTLAKNPSAWAAHNDLGTILAAETNYEGAMDQFMASLDANRDNNPDAHANLGQLLAIQGKFALAEAHLREALRLDPLNTQTLQLFGATLAQEGKPAEAARQWRASLSIKPETPTRLALAAMSMQSGDIGEAVAQYRQVLAVKGESVEALNNLAFILATASDDHLRNGPEAVRLAERAVRLPPVPGMCVNGTLAAAYAEAGRFPEAVSTAEKAIQEEKAAGETRFADLNGQLLTFYRAGQPWHGTIVRSASPSGTNTRLPKSP